MMIEWSFPPRPEAARTARQLVADSIPRLPREASDAVTLMVSELVTNCIVHAGTDFQVRVHLDEASVRVEVSDHGTGKAAARSPERHEAHGRGLQLVQSLADEWGVIPALIHPGKTVWFRLSLAGEQSAVLR
ncbi:MAG: hypothetical protein QOE97_2423 [Pseudonocardiales bacterium]|jgi:anti-sigma regulatory factor (Ser/Thr protein kinase)|nr:hypothetical protein [Pseudonocardiales bacterium]